MLYPDPIVSANVYASGKLDAVFRHTLEPFQARLAERQLDREIYFWTMRYGSGGEHLKIRVHGPEHAEATLRQILGECLGEALAGLPGGPAPESKTPTPPIDVEDGAGPHADRSWCWTTYQRSVISLGSKPFLLEDAVVAHLTRCLGASCRVALEALVPEADAAVSHLVRHNNLTQLLVEGLGAVELEDAQRREYLVFHRDWLVRYPLLKSGGSLAKAREVTRQFEQIRSQMPEELESLGQTAHTSWHTPDRKAGTWRSALAAFWSATVPLCEEPGGRVDPFAPDPRFNPLFKVFHGAANQLGLSMFEEALVHHLLACAVAPTEPVRLDIPFEPVAQAASL